MKDAKTSVFNWVANKQDKSNWVATIFRLEAP